MLMHDDDESCSFIELQERLARRLHCTFGIFGLVMLTQVITRRPEVVGSGVCLQHEPMSRYGPRARHSTLRIYQRHRIW
ncbi:hypothetical protein DL98DRAFT_77368 [Cadophora sp. DSE1049]|nr:hypothetical protein DL98DRAFT_77368 [Cadophora sp. DSE1049]